MNWYPSKRMYVYSTFDNLIWSVMGWKDVGDAVSSRVLSWLIFPSFSRGFVLCMGLIILQLSITRKQVSPVSLLLYMSLEKGGGVREKCVYIVFGIG